MPPKEEKPNGIEMTGRSDEDVGADEEKPDLPTGPSCVTMMEEGVSTSLSFQSGAKVAPDDVPTHWYDSKGKGEKDDKRASGSSKPELKSAKSFDSVKGLQSTQED